MIMVRILLMVRHELLLGGVARETNEVKTKRRIES